MRRTVRLAETLRGSEAEELADEVVGAMKALLEGINNFDDDWTRTKAKDQAFEEGQKVAIALNWQKRYEGLFDEDELDDLTITKKVEGKKRAIYAVTTATGAKLFVQAGHLRNA